MSARCDVDTRDFFLFLLQCHLVDASGSAIKATQQKTFHCSKTVHPDWAGEASRHRDKTNILHFIVDQNRKKISGAEITVLDKNGDKFMGLVSEGGEGERERERERCMISFGHREREREREREAQRYLTRMYIH